MSKSMSAEGGVSTQRGPETRAFKSHRAEQEIFT